MQKGGAYVGGLAESTKVRVTEALRGGQQVGVHLRGVHVHLMDGRARQHVVELIAVM